MEEVPVQEDRGVQIVHERSRIIGDLAAVSVSSKMPTQDYRPSL
jgi:hypothetical protein